MKKDSETAISSSTQSYLLRWILLRIWTLCIVLTCGLVFAALFSLLARSHWAADIFANLRVQQMIGLIATMLATCALKKWKWLGLQCVIFAIHAPWFASAFWGNETKASQTELVVMVANVLTANSMHDAIIDQVRDHDPDVFAIVELSSTLAQKIQTELVHEYPHHIAAPQDNGNFGVGIWSRYPMPQSDTFALNLDRIKTVESVVENDGHFYRIIATHPLPPMGGEKTELRNEHLNQLAERIAQSGSVNEPTKESMIVMGDFNLTPWSPIFSDFESRTALHRAGRGYGLTPTWYSKPLFPFGIKIDHVLLSGDLVCTKHQVGGYNGSDHRPVIVGVTSKR